MTALAATITKIGADVRPSISVVLDTQYGQQIVRPVCAKAEIFCQMAGTKTLTKPTIELIKALGYRVDVVPTQPTTL